MNINYEYYRVFYYVVKHRNFTQAAGQLMNSQPNITRMIRNLEHALGCRLFNRSNRGVCLTPEGEKLYDHVKIAVEQIMAGESEIEHLVNLQRGTLSIGASEVALHCFLLPVLKEYQKRFPHIRLKVSNHSTPQAIAALQSGMADIAFITTPIGSTQGLKVTPIREIREVAVCGTAFADLARRELTLADLSGYPIVSLGEQTRTFRLYAELFERNHLFFSPDVETATADQILPMVRSNLGIGFLPEEFLNLHDSPDVYRLHLTAPLPIRTICCVQLAEKPLSIAADALQKMIFPLET